MTLISTTDEWAELRQMAHDMSRRDLSGLFEEEPDRAQQWTFEQGGILADLSKHYINQPIKQGLTRLAELQGFDDRVKALFNCEVVNVSEKRPAIHPVLRDYSERESVAGYKGLVNKQWQDAARLARRLRSATWLGFDGSVITDVVNIGIGGSSLGPELLHHAFGGNDRADIQAHFITNVDSDELYNKLKVLDPATTVFVVVSKTFTTQETMANARAAIAWFKSATGTEHTWRDHFIGVSSEPDRMSGFGIKSELQLTFDRAVGGRYSLWSTAAFTVMTAHGIQMFERFLYGGHLMDEHFRNTRIMDNMPAMLGLLDVFNISFLQFPALAFVPYSKRLRYLPDYLQQLFMESNGKHVTNEGEFVDYPTQAVIWGQTGTEAQHAFFQALHQGTSCLPVEMLVGIDSSYDGGHHKGLAPAHAIAQARALMSGKRSPPDEPFCHYPGGKPSTMIMFERLTPQVLGQLIAMYEHRTLTQSVIWGINPFDQFGVELGKTCAGEVLRALFDSNSELNWDNSSHNLVQWANDRFAASSQDADIS